MEAHLEASLPTAAGCRNSGNNRRHSQRDAAAAQPWTATRCHRLLRPLLSHLTALRREKAALALKSIVEEPHMEPASPGKRSRPLETEGGVVGGRKRVRYTYSLKGTARRQGRRAASSSAATTPGKQQQHLPRNDQQKQPPVRTNGQTRPGEVVVSTPVFYRARKQRQDYTLPSSPLPGRLTNSPTTDVTTGPSTASRTDNSNTGTNTLACRGYYGNPLGPRGKGGGKNFLFEAEWARLRKVAPPELHQLYVSVFRAVEALLRATAAEAVSRTSRKGRESKESKTGKTHKGSKGVGSLLAMCLRRVPLYVAEREAAERKEAAEIGAAPSSSASLPGPSDMYADLETMGYGGRGGWAHLRTVVRAHGISLLRNACAEGLVGVTFVRLLVRLCAHLGAFAEAEELLSALMARDSSGSSFCAYPPPLEGAKGTLSERTAAPLSALQFLAEYARDSGRLSLLFRQLTGLLQSARLPAAWLSTQAFSQVWEQAIRALSSSSVPSCGAEVLLDFAAAAIQQLVYLPQGSPGQETKASSSPSYRTLTSVLASLAAVAVLRQEAVLAADGHGAASLCQTLPVLQRLVVLVERTLAEGEPCGHRNGKQGRKRKRNTGSVEANHDTITVRRFLLGLAPFLASPSQGGRGDSKGDGDDDSGNDKSRSALWCQRLAQDADLGLKRQFYESTVAMITTVSQSCGRGAVAAASAGNGDPKSSRAYLVQLCDKVADALGSCFPPEWRHALNRRLQADSAFLLASRTNDLRDLAFAERLCAHQAAGDGESVRKEAVPQQEHAESNVDAGIAAATATHTADLFSGYRWEEGISEWVVASPETAARRRVSDGDSDSNNDGDNDSNNEDGDSDSNNEDGDSDSDELGSTHTPEPTPTTRSTFLLSRLRSSVMRPSTRRFSPASASTAASCQSATPSASSAYSASMSSPPSSPASACSSASFVQVETASDDDEWEMEAASSKTEIRSTRSLRMANRTASPPSSPGWQPTARKRTRQPLFYGGRKSWSGQGSLLGLVSDDEADDGDGNGNEVDGGNGNEPEEDNDDNDELAEATGCHSTTSCCFSWARCAGSGLKKSRPRASSRRRWTLAGASDVRPWGTADAASGSDDELCV